MISTRAAVMMAFLSMLSWKVIAGEFFYSDKEKSSFLADLYRNWDSIDRWSIDYELPVILPDRRYVRRTVEMAAPSYYHDFTAHGLAGSYPWHEDAFPQAIYIHGGKYVHAWPFSRQYSESLLRPGQAIPGSTFQDIIWSIVPKFTITEYSMPPSTDTGLPVVLGLALYDPRFRMLIRSEIVNGETCAIFDANGIQRIWVATNKPLCLMQRESRDRESGNVFERITTRSVSEIRPGLWYPKEYHVAYFRRGLNERPEVLDRQITVKVLEFKVGQDVSLSRFVPQRLPGTIKTQSNLLFTQVEPGGEEVLSNIVRFARKYAGLPTNKQGKPVVIWLVAGLVCGVLAARALFPARKADLSAGTTKVNAPPVSATAENNTIGPA